MEKLTELSEAAKDKFIDDGFIKIEHAFSTVLADECRSILWKDTGCDPNDRSTWTKAVIRLGEYSQKPFAEAANTPVLHAAFDAFVGKGSWLPRGSLGTFPVRFPASEEPNDTGWHVEASFAGTDPYDYMNYRINIRSKGRCLLMLFIFSDISEADAPTKIRVGSHLKTAEILAPHGETGLSFMELAALTEKATAGFRNLMQPVSLERFISVILF